MVEKTERSTPATSDGASQMARYRFQLLLGSLVALLLLYPAAEAIEYGELFLHGVASLVLLAGVYSVASNAAIRIGAASLAVVAIAGDLAVLAGAGEPVLVASLATEATFELLIDFAVLRSVIAARKVDADVLAGGLCAYLLTGMAFASVYSIVELLAPGSCAFPEPVPASPQWKDFVFFSFTTLTTLGYGDIRPVSDFARSLTSAESILGVFYMAILVSRLVSLYGDHQAGGPHDSFSPYGEAAGR